MDRNLKLLVAFVTDLEKLKLVPRQAYVSDLSRRENSAEHSWHLAVALLALARELDLEIDLSKAVIMALIHDTCEIDAGDISVYDAQREGKAALERACVERLAGYGLEFAAELKDLWLEYEAQQTMESRWVRVLDRLMPFIVNLATGGESWKERGIARSQVLRISEPVRIHAPEIFSWMQREIDLSVEKGWLRDA
jgi:putative hydrolase of HD superfamily